MGKITLEGGKYTIVNELDDGGSLSALRNGHARCAISGDGLVLAMYHEIERLQAEVMTQAERAIMAENALAEIEDIIEQPRKTEAQADAMLWKIGEKISEAIRND